MKIELLFILVVTSIWNSPPRFLYVSVFFILYVPNQISPPQ